MPADLGRDAAAQQHAPVAQFDPAFVGPLMGNDVGHQGSLFRRVPEQRHGVGHDVGRRQCFGLAAIDAPHLQHLRVDEAHRLVWIRGLGGEDGITGGVQGAAQVVGTGRRSQPVLLLFRDIAGDQDHSARLRGVVKERVVSGFHVAIDAHTWLVGDGPHPLRGAVADAGPQGLVPHGASKRQGHGIDRLVEHLLAGQSGAPEPRVVDHPVALIRVHHADPVGDRIDHGFEDAQVVFGHAQRGDVGPHAHRSGLLTGCVEDGRGMVDANHPAAIWAGDADLIAALLSLAAGGNFAVQSVQVGPLEVVEGTVADQLISGSAQQGAHGWIDGEGPGLGVQSPDAQQG